MLRVTRSDFANAPEMFEDEPVVVQDIISVPKSDQWWDHIKTRSHNELVQVLHDGQRTTKLRLAQATELVSEKSTHWDPLYLSSIGSSCSTDQLPLYDALEELFVNTDTEFDDTMDWFACLGQHAPIFDTLIVAGQGATSPTICSHPFTKMILCLQGSQLLRVMPPNETQWKELAKPVWSQAWDGFPFSLGSQLSRDLNLFAYRHREVDEEEPYTTYSHYAEDPSQFHPNFALPLLEDCDRTNHDLWHSTVMLPSDVAVIPPGWWYQTYNVEDTPNVCVYSQRCGGSAMGKQMIQHILQSTFGNIRLRMLSQDDDYYYAPDEAQDLVDKVFDILEEHYEDDNDNDTARQKKKSQSER